MYCYEDAKNDVQVPAVALCRGCGAAVCAGHLRETVTENVVRNGVGAPTVRPDGRALACLTCSAVAA
ncbi:DUF2180 family protein [Cellulomonas pakistanensis]|uniref:DUF2180 family protein n=1 Tax=Cellulomonas pakistanensis TaxID=992287 RepID=A0A919PAX5_9CELL|nr:DUF2180 family protein [Cellulomonas pakistanensis]GIG36823.1 hypothetical protein Cpa01nite_22040 [Cellulomonas pakistanensis]